MKKRILSIVLCMSLLVAACATTMVVSAADDIATDGYCAEISGYRAEGNFTAPITPNADGKVFAGWYTDNTFTTAIAPSVTSGPAYAKFVDPAVFTIQNQFNTEANTHSETVNLRIVTTIDSEWYAGIAFTFTCEGVGTKTLPIDTVYTSLVNYESAKTQFCEDSEYFAVEKITGIPASVYTSNMSIAPVYTTYDGTVITGTTRDALVLAQKLPAAEAGEVCIFEMPGATGSNINFITSGNDTVPYADDWSKLYSATTGGIYVDGMKNTGGLFIKLGANRYYMLMEHLGVTPVEGMQIHIEGAFAEHWNKTDPIVYHPVTFEFDGSNWNLVSHETYFPEPEEGETEVYLYDKYTANDSTINFTSSSNDTVPSGNWSVVYSATATGGVYINGVKKDGVVIMKNGENFYQLWMGHISGYTPASGDTIHIEGTFAYGEYTITFHPATFKYDGGWGLVSRKALPVTLSENYQQDKTLWFNSSSNDTLPYSSGWAYQYKAVDGGVYVDGIKNEGLVLVKVSANTYLVYLGGVNVEEGTQIRIEGTFATLDTAADEVAYNSATFEYDGYGWKLVS